MLLELISFEILSNFFVFFDAELYFNLIYTKSRKNFFCIEQFESLEQFLIDF